MNWGLLISCHPATIDHGVNRPSLIRRLLSDARLCANDRKVALLLKGNFRQCRGLYCPGFVRKSITLRARVVRDPCGPPDRANPATPDSAGNVAPQSGMPAYDNSDGHL